MSQLRKRPRPVLSPGGLVVKNGLNISLLILGGMSKALEKTAAKVEAISHHEKRNQQTGSAKHRKLLYNFELK